MPLAPPEFQYLRDLIAKRSGNVISPAQDYLLESRLNPVANSFGLANVTDLVRALRGGNQTKLEDRIVEAMTINETSFFRDMHPFNALRDSVLPAMIEARKAVRELSIWSGACSTGQEPYSLAMLMRDHFPQLLDWKIKITATDLSDEVLEKARGGNYSQFEVNRGLPAKMLVKFFDRQGKLWRVKDAIRSMIDFRKLNLTQPTPMYNAFDIVFLRNVMIYFDEPTKKMILGRVHRSLRPDGYLFVGGGETLINLDVPFRREDVGQVVVYRPKN